MNKQSKKAADAIMKLCPKFIRCSVPICPLDLFQEERDYIKGEPKCRLSKSKRIKIAKGTDLPRQGMTKREWAAYKYWQNLNNTEKAKNLAHLRAISSISSCNLSPSQVLNDNRPVDENQPKTLMQK